MNDIPKLPINPNLEDRREEGVLATQIHPVCQRFNK